ncbi:MAG: PA14 domain-containing protein [Anaerolineae bacterium]
MTALVETARAESSHERLRPRRTLNQLALALLGVIIGLVGQGLLRRDSLWDGLLLLALAAFIFVRAVGRTQPGELGAGDPYRGLDKPLGVRTGPAAILGLIGLGAALVVSWLAYRAFGDGETVLRAWDLYLASLAALLVGTFLLTRGESFWHLWPKTSAIRWLLFLTFMLALFMRLWRFEAVPFGTWYDEAISGLQGVRWNAEPLFRPQFKENNPGQLIFLFAAALRWLGHSIQAIRLVQVGVGLAGVLAAYFFGRELHGPRFGLALAFFVAVARWHVNFSRIAMPGVDTPLFEFLTLLFLTRLLRRGYLRDAVWAGVSLGFGLSVYSAFRLFVLAAGIFAVLAALIWQRWWSRVDRRDWWLKLGARLAMVALALWLTAMPVAHFAQSNPTAFWGRVQRTAIFNIRDEPDLARAIGRTFRLHLLMFNFHGDNNGRHNLPGEPMLDPVMGVLFILGLGLALVRWQQPANVFFLLLLPIGLLGGALSLDFEAPQSLRSIAVLPSVFYFCTLSLAVLGRQAEQNLRPLSDSWLAAPALVLGGYVFFFNAHTYFVRQAQDFASWHAFSTAESITARRMAELGPDYTFYLSPFLSNHPSIRFLSPDTPDRRVLALPDPLPVRQPADRPAALFIHPDDAWIYELAQRLYVSGKFETVFDPKGENPVVYIVRLARENLAQIQGLELRYWPGPGWDGPAQAALRARNIDVSWPDQSPLAAGSAATFTAEWSGVLYVPEYGLHRLILRAPGRAWLELDGETVAQVEETGGEGAAALNLAQGNHRLRLRAASGMGQVSLSWQRPGRQVELIPQWALYSPPVSNHGLQGDYYANPNWEGLPAFSRIDPFLDIYFHLTPLPRPYSVEWTGVLDAPQAGVYALGLQAVDWAELSIDGQRVVETGAPNVYAEGTAQLTPGLHDLRLRFKDTMSRSELHLLWRPPGRELEAIPAEHLWPPQGDYPAETPAAPLAPFEAPPVRLVPLTTLGGPGSALGQFLEPRDVALGPDGRLYVADTGNRRVQVFSPDYQPLAAWETAGDQPLVEPLAVVISPAGEVWVLDSTEQWVYRFTPDGEFRDRFGGAEARWFHPRGLTVFEDGSLAVTDTGNGRVTLYSPDGLLLGTLGTLGRGPGQFIEPVDVARDLSGTYFVTEGIEMHRLQRLDAFGVPLAQWLIPPTVALDGAHLAWLPGATSGGDQNASLLVTSSASASLLRYGPDGTLIDEWQAIESIAFQQPVGIFVDGVRQRLYITDVASHQIYVFQIEFLTR